MSAAGLRARRVSAPRLTIGVVLAVLLSFFWGDPSPRPPLGGTQPPGPLLPDPRARPITGFLMLARPGAVAATRIVLNDTGPGGTRTRRAQDAGGRAATLGRLRKERTRCLA
jgi:hypothetical protein